MIGRIVGAALGTAITRGRRTDPIAGAAIGAAAMFVARRILPARLVIIGGTIAAAFATRQFAQVAERRAARDGGAAAAPTTTRRARLPNAPKPAKRPAKVAAQSPRAPALRRPRATAAPAPTRPPATS